MTASDSTTPELGSQISTYNRKQKSLSLLCSNFLGLYDHEGVELIGLDDAASRLGVERRRMYDIVNVLESVGILERRAKNQYLWNGFKALPNAFMQLKKEGFRDNFSDINEDDRREKSLGSLTQNFLKLFLCSNVSLISLDKAAKILLGNSESSSSMRTKIRRLYDITNVLSSIGVIEKTHHEDTRKPAFRWLAVERRENRCSEKRKFGADLSNRSSFMKKCKTETSNSETLERKQKTEVEDDDDPEGNSVEYGPAGISHGENRYHNQAALHDLFLHYVEARKAWCLQIAQEKAAATHW